MRCVQRTFVYELTVERPNKPLECILYYMTLVFVCSVSIFTTKFTTKTYRILKINKKKQKWKTEYKVKLINFYILEHQRRKEMTHKRVNSNGKNSSRKLTEVWREIFVLIRVRCSWMRKLHVGHLLCWMVGWEPPFVCRFWVFHFRHEFVG